MNTDKANTVHQATDITHKRFLSVFIGVHQWLTKSGGLMLVAVVSYESISWLFS
jgi:hypothetical protein